MGTLSCISAIFSKGDNLCILYAFVNDESLPKEMNFAKEKLGKKMKMAELLPMKGYPFTKMVKMSLTIHFDAHSFCTFSHFI